MYKVQLEPLAILSGPEALPPELAGLDRASLADLSAALDPCPDQWAGVGYWPATRAAAPDFDPQTHRLSGAVSTTADSETSTVVETPIAAELTNEMRREAVRAAGELTPLQFQLRLTQAERIAIRASTDPEIVDYRELAALAQSINLLDPMTAAGLQLLVVEGILTADRVPEILGFDPE